ncbi:unnamed protein product, partial [Brenthis ino]
MSIKKPHFKVISNMPFDDENNDRSQCRLSVACVYLCSSEDMPQLTAAGSRRRPDTLATAITLLIRRDAAARMLIRQLYCDVVSRIIACRAIPS